MLDSIQAVEGNISLFSDECLSIHGLYDAFYSRNGWGRTAVYLLTWCVFGGVFFYLTAPLVEAYHTKTVITHVKFAEATKEGLSLPIVTVCPHGRNVIQCNCLLWGKLYNCRYSVVINNTEWRDRFGVLGCIRDFEKDSTGRKVWTDPQCEQLASCAEFSLVDPCYSSEQEMKDSPFLLQM
jgi:hypothetical protein